MKTTLQSPETWRRGDAPRLPAHELGGKAAHLLRLSEAGFPVPPWMCLPASFIAEMLERLPRSSMERLASLDSLSREQIEALGRDIREAIAALCFRDDECHDILRACDDAFGPDAMVAVRSSAVGEDGREHSFAGQLDTFLYVPRAALPARIRDCCASAFTDRALAYRARQALGAEVRFAILIQRMIDSEVSGILFTANPATGNRRELIIAAGYGLGEGVVGNHVETDAYHVDRDSRAMHCAPALKSRRVVRDRATGAGTTIVPVPLELARREALRREQVDSLVDIALRIEQVFGCPQDVEWAFDATGAAFILQARPITSLPEGTHRIFDNANVVEGYPGVTTPLTFSFARATYEAVFRGMARALGVEERILRKERAALSTMIGFLHGRIYYHLPSWYRFYSLVPGFTRNMQAWEHAMGTSNPELWRTEQARARATAHRPLLAQGKVVGHALWGLATLPRTIRRLNDGVQRAGAVHGERLVSARSVDDLLALYDELVVEPLHDWAPAMINDLCAFNFYHLLQELLRDSGLEEPEALCAALLCGISGMESVEPVRSLLRLVATIRQSPSLLALFTNKLSDQEVWDRLQREHRHADFLAAAKRHIDRFGDRTIEEQKLETPGLAEMPAQLVRLCRPYLELDRDIESQENREASLRAAAERALREGLRRRPWRFALVWLALQQTRVAMRNRENTRLARTRTYGMAKRIFRAVGERLARAGIIAAPEDVYFLTVEEIQGCARGTSVSESLHELVRLRRAEHERHLTIEPPNRLEIHGMVRAGLSSSAAPPAPTPALDTSSGVLRGQGCANGKVRARARIVHNPRDETDVAGAILVAPSTDPGWVFLMMAASGLVVERGNLLSHTAIIGRELGIPTVIGVAGATRRIPNGARVELDGSAGTITILKEHET
jgi:phosphohistidine swiveling domain-containing protein